jgi:hypothetical protein
MDFITAIWGKINKPHYYFAAGIALLLVAPADIRWSGWLFLAVGAVGVAEWAYEQIKSSIHSRKKRSQLHSCFDTLNEQEKYLLREQWAKSEQTFYMSPFIAGGIAQWLARTTLYQGLADKGILIVSSADAEGKALTIHVADEAWPIVGARLIRS